MTSTLKNKFLNFFLLITVLFFVGSVSTFCFAEDKSDPVMRRKTKSKVTLKENESDEDTEVVAQIDQGSMLGYGQFNIGLSRIRGSLAGGGMVSGAYVLSERYLIGVDFQGFSSNKEESLPRKGNMTSSYNAKAQYQQIGLLFGYIENSHRISHMVYSLKIGQGQLEWDGEDVSFIDETYSNLARFFIVEPTVEWELNMTKYVRFVVGGSARLPLSSPKKTNFEPSDVLSPVLYLGFKAGNFRY